MNTVTVAPKRTSSQPTKAFKAPPAPAPPRDSNLTLSSYFQPEHLQEVVIPPEYLPKVFILETFGTWDPDRSIWERLQQLSTRDGIRETPFHRLRHPLFPLALFREETEQRTSDVGRLKTFAIHPDTNRIQLGLKLAFAIHHEDASWFRPGTLDVTPFHVTCWRDWIEPYCPACGHPSDFVCYGLPFCCPCGNSCMDLTAWYRFQRVVNLRVALLLAHLDEDTYRFAFRSFYREFDGKNKLRMHEQFLLWLQLMPPEGPRCRREEVSPLVRKLWQRLQSIRATSS